MTPFLVTRLVGARPALALITVLFTCALSGAKSDRLPHSPVSRREPSGPTLSKPPRPFETHQERTVTGQYVAAERTIPAGAYRVPMNQPLARLPFYLLEPRSNDGLVTWNVLDDAIKQSQYPILRTRN